MKRTNIYLSEPEGSTLAGIAKKRGISTSELIRRLISKYLEDVDENGNRRLNIDNDYSRLIKE